ncbi:unnamed protein product [Protopolystoma xenopodis]|uniref:Uncharacterized protein n=1 Tax=Protopolystoma xenopodis TaxID=117903 RepID=A0A3S5C7I4_9PLAT|nr:unnamed protein product [Protopolystoma xenopodis]
MSGIGTRTVSGGSSAGEEASKAARVDNQRESSHASLNHTTHRLSLHSAGASASLRPPHGSGWIRNHTTTLYSTSHTSPYRYTLWSMWSGCPRFFCE